jgi:NTP pyrophosphatase (non-canonical NTP hydrolase)
MKKKFNELHNLIIKDHEKSEWAKDCKFKQRITEFIKEVKEIEAALNNNDLENLKEELGDALWDLIYSIHLANNENLFKAEEVFNEIIKKINRRKPWINKEKEVSKEEELKIWYDVKTKEKQSS